MMFEYFAHTLQMRQFAHFLQRIGPANYTAQNSILRSRNKIKIWKKKKIAWLIFCQLKMCQRKESIKGGGSSAYYE